MSNLDLQLNAVRKELLTMGAMVEEAIRAAVFALTQRRSEAVSRIIREDRQIDDQENRIDQACARILALQRPVADDLRLVLTVLVINGVLERLGDHAKNIARAARNLSGTPPLPVYVELERMADLVLAMLGDCLDALVDKDTAKARSITSRDDEVDEQCRLLHGRLLLIMQTDGGQVPQAVEVLGAVHDMERIGDLTAAIARDVIYSIDGRQARREHHRLPPSPALEPWRGDPAQAG